MDTLIEKALHQVVMNEWTNAGANCGQSDNGYYLCCRAAHHDGYHVACGINDEICHVWADDDALSIPQGNDNVE